MALSGANALLPALVMGDFQVADAQGLNAEAL